MWNIISVSDDGFCGDWLKAAKWVSERFAHFSSGTERGGGRERAQKKERNGQNSMSTEQTNKQEATKEKGVENCQSMKLAFFRSFVRFFFCPPSHVRVWIINESEWRMAIVFLFAKYFDWLQKIGDNKRPTLKWFVSCVYIVFFFVAFFFRSLPLRNTLGQHVVIRNRHSKSARNSIACETGTCNDFYVEL